MTNGHPSEPDADHEHDLEQPTRSESELSDLHDLPPVQNHAIEHGPSDDDAIHDMATSEMDEDDDAPGEDDADFEAESPRAEPTNGMRHDRSPSEESLRPGKRKPDVDDEEYMKQNPELYGLRRSVRVADPAFRLRFANSLLPSRDERAQHAEWYVHLSH